MRRSPVRSLAVLAALGALALTGCGTETSASAGGEAPVGSDRTIRAHQVMQLTKVHEETGMTLLEGPTFDENGDLMVVDVTAPEGNPKVMRVDVRKKKSHAFHTDGRGLTPRPSSARTTDGSTSPTTHTARSSAWPRAAVTRGPSSPARWTARG